MAQTLTNNRMTIRNDGTGHAALVIDPNGELVPASFAQLTGDEKEALLYALYLLAKASAGKDRMKHGKTIYRLLERHT